MHTNNYSIADIMNYLYENYVTIEQLAQQSQIAPTQIQQWITHQCIPTYSHRRSRKTIFHTEVFGDTIIEEENFYYSPSVVDWIKKANQLANQFTLAEMPSQMFEHFKNDLHASLISNEESYLWLTKLFDRSRNLIEEKLHEFAQECWAYVLDGTYGVCLYNVCAENIVIKAIAIAKLETLQQSRETTSQSQQQALTKAIQQYNSVVTEFAPHELTKSSRWRLINSR